MRHVTLSLLATIFSISTVFRRFQEPAHDFINSTRTSLFGLVIYPAERVKQSVNLLRTPRSTEKEGNYENINLP